MNKIKSDLYLFWHLKVKCPDWVLKLNHIIFWWYYNRVDNHFKQWTFVESIKLLISNYEWRVKDCESEKELRISAGKIADEYQNKYQKLQMNIMIDSHQAKNINAAFGTDFSTFEDN